jgi:hypothetical protein
MQIPCLPSANVASPRRALVSAPQFGRKCRHFQIMVVALGLWREIHLSSSATMLISRYTLSLTNEHQVRKWSREYNNILAMGQPISDLIPTLLMLETDADPKQGKE